MATCMGVMLWILSLRNFFACYFLFRQSLKHLETTAISKCRHKEEFNNTNSGRAFHHSTQNFDISIFSTYLLLLEKLTGFQLAKKFPAFYGTRRFITAFTSARQLCLSLATSIQSMQLNPTSWRYILILSSPSTPGFSKWSFSLRFPHQNPV